MKTKEAEQKEKERAAKIKELRKDIEEKLEEQLPEEMLEQNIRVEVEKVNVNEELDPLKAKQVVEALLFASSKPLMPAEIRRTVKSLSIGDIKSIIGDLNEEYLRSQRSFEIREIAGGFEIGTRKEFAPWICKIELQKKTRQATHSALETLAIMAYKQPVTRAEIEELRGVDASGVLSTLMERGLIKIQGKKEIPGRPFLYVTTDKFLEHFGLPSLKELPNIDEIKNLVENSVNREQLLGTTNMVEVPQEEQGAGESVPQETPAVETKKEETEVGNAQEDRSEEASRKD